MAEEMGTSKKPDGMLRSVYDDSIYFIDSIIQEYSVFPTILDRMRSGNATIELRKRYLLRAIDETWVNIIEDTLPALDVIIRNPSKFIEDKEEIIPVELARKVSVRTLQHLSQHTNLISRIEGDMIIPSKLLNVYKDETMQTYENKFVNTLINRLYLFVNRRYEIALNAGQDEKTTSIEFKDDFDHDSVKVRMNFRVEIAESSDGESDRVERNYSYTTDLWKRVERLNGIVTNYANSDFANAMGHSYIRPPVMRTNAILKNKNLRQCLALWQFIESYDSAGYSMLIQENLENVDESYIKELYSTLALQYMIFRYNIHNEFEADSTLASDITTDDLKPRIIDELSKASGSEFDIKDPPPEKTAKAPAEERYGTLTPEDMLLLESLDVAMDASDIIRENGEEFIYDPFFIPEPGPEEVAEVEPEKEPDDEEETQTESFPEPEESVEPEPEAEPVSEPCEEPKSEDLDGKDQSDDSSEGGSDENGEEDEPVKTEDEAPAENGDDVQL